MVSSLTLANSLRNYSSGMDRSILKNILKENCNLSIWHRKLSIKISSFVVDLLTTSNFKSLQVSIEELEKLYDEIPLLHHPNRIDFIEDIIMLGSLYQDSTGIKNPTIHLSTISRMQCPLFHVDFNQLRMVCTFYGSGTLWVDESNSDRSHLGCGHNDHIVRDINQIREVPVGSVALLKGERYPGNLGYGIIHKSPEVQIGTKRLFLRIE